MLDEKISKFMLKFSKFEFYLITQFLELARTTECPIKNCKKIAGLNWERLAKKLEEKNKFSDFLNNKHFPLLSTNPPQYVVITDKRKLKWDSDEAKIDSWETFLTRSLAQLRNNVAHGNKALENAQFTDGRSEEFIEEASRLTDFIIKTLTGKNDWETGIFFN